jgi:integral membrane protein
VPDFADDPSSEVARKARALRVVAVVETCTYLLLLFFWQGAHSDVGVAVVGFFHGLVWMAFVAMTVILARDIGWTWGYVVLVVVTGPVGGLLVYERLRREDLSGDRSAPAPR